MTPLILITNDDGVQSDGIAAVARALEPVGEVVVVAPARQQSAASHAITLSSPLRVRTLRPRWHAVNGTPADAVFVALHEICARKPDVVVSGINHGANLGTDVFYSGTVAGALEGALRGIPAVAVSQQLPEGVAPEEREEGQRAGGFDPIDHVTQRLAEDLQATARFTAALVQRILTAPLPDGIALNVNAPCRPTDRYRWTRVGRRRYRGEVVRRLDPRGLPYFWIAGPGVEAHDDPRSDSHAVEAGLISVSALRLDWSADVLPPAGEWAFEGYERGGEGEA
ncbi:MAG: 5'/3'-nucleotidase SurE [Deltaproteobacteria bacterium]|nr:5'/3'-nucleotidase SurE [Deltaproteobacteria bacterium]